MNILFVGDIHGDFEVASRMLERQFRANEVDLVVQAGDFGYWPGLDRIDKGLDQMNDVLAQYNVPMLFADGNHEDHDALDALAKEGFFEGSRVVRSFIQHMRRGSIADWGTFSIAFFGGGTSLDRQRRTPGYDWFFQEAPNVDDLRELVASMDKRDGEAVDVMVTHEVPSLAGPKYDDENSHHGASWFPAQERAAAHALRDGVMTQALHIAKPRHWYYGHHHQSSVEFGLGAYGTDFYGLHMNGSLDKEWTMLNVYAT